MIEEITEPMSVSMAVTHFSEPLERKMRQNGDVDAADLCRDIREWCKSQDDPGIPAKDRIAMRKRLRKRLLDEIDFKGINDFSLQFGKIITRYRRIGYNLNVMRQSACLVFNPIMVDNYAAFFNCTPVGRASDSMMAPT